MMDKKMKIAFVVFLIAALMSGLYVGYALTGWTESGSGSTTTPTPTPTPTASPVQSFNVNNSLASGQTVDFGAVPPDAVIIRAYVVTNDGNVEVTVQANVDATNCAGDFDISSGIIAVGSHATFILTLTNFSGEWSYQVNFNKV